jgi:hypothetical protein
MSFNNERVEAFNDLTLSFCKNVMEGKITIYEYIASNRPMDAHLLLNNYGKYRKARSVKELESQLKRLVRDFGSDALEELAKIHPDKELIEQTIKSEVEDAKANKSVKEEVIDTLREVNNYRNVDGQSMTTPQTQIDTDSKEYIRQSRIMIWGSLTLIAVAVLMSRK